jgi:four helix bundle protein
MASVMRFEDLKVWQKARRLAFEIHRVSADGKRAHDYALVDQLRRATISIASNIAEGFERGRPTHFAQFLGYARGSCAELRAQLYLAADVGWLCQDDLTRVLALTEEVGRMLRALYSTQRRPQPQ